MAEHIIEVKNLVKTYGSFTAVKDISFHVKEGEIFGLLGPNGAGKTTTLEIIETLKRASSGMITLDGLDVAHDIDKIKPRIGIQLQAAGFYPSLTLVEILEMFGVMYGVSVQPMELLKKMNLEDKKDAMYDKMSGGQKQRFSIATTLVNEPRVIFLDEPTTGLDPQARINLWEVIRNLRDEGVTIVITTHYMDEAEQLCDRLVIMDHGQIIAEGAPHKLVKDLLESGFEPHKEVQQATLEDVFLNLTGRSLRES